MSNDIPMDVLLDNAGRDYDDLSPEVQAMCDAIEGDLAKVGIDVDADVAATNDGPTSVVVPAVDSPIQTFSSRTKARTFARENGGKFIDNGVGSESRWTVDTSVTKPARAVKKSAATAVVKPAAGGTDKKSAAIAVYRELESAGTLKRATFLTRMESVGLSAKGASNYFYRIKNGAWSKLQPTS